MKWKKVCSAKAQFRSAFALYGYILQLRTVVFKFCLAIITCFYVLNNTNHINYGIVKIQIIFLTVDFHDYFHVITEES